MFENTNKALYRFHVLSSRLSNIKEHGENCGIQAAAKKEIDAALKLVEGQKPSTNSARAKFSPDCCDESKQDLRDWIECGFKFCPWCGRELRPIA